MNHTPPQPPIDAVEADEREAYERVVARQAAYNYRDFVGLFPHKSNWPAWDDGEVQPYFGALLNSPLVADHISELGVVYRSRGERDDSYSHADREWIDMVLSHDLDWNVVLYIHAFDAVAVGVRPEAIKALREGRDDDLAPRERMLRDYIRMVHTGSVTSEAYRDLEADLGRRGAVEFTAFVGHLIMTFRLMQAFGVPDRSDQELDELIDGLIDGTVQVPDAAARVPSIDRP